MKQPEWMLHLSEIDSDPTDVLTWVYNIVTVKPVMMWSGLCGEVFVSGLQKELSKQEHLF